MEASPPAPPVPPKDAKYLMELDRPSTATTSASKRKRPSRDETYNDDDSHHETDDPERRPTPSKRSKAVPAVKGDGYTSASEDATPAHPRNLRRKKASNNLSNMNLRHAAQQQASHTHTHAFSRASRFQEGSLNDRPSDKPPSIFTRAERSASGHVDQLMQDYHDDMHGPSASTVRGDADRRSSNMQLPADIDDTKKDGNAGFFQFGRQWAASFLPTNLFRRSKIWTEQKDEVAQRRVEEIGRKAKQKVDAEAKYAEMKKYGQLGLQPVGRLDDADVAETETPRDSGVEINGIEYTRSVSQASWPMHSMDSESEVPDTTSKSKTLKPRLHFKKPSLTNIRSGLKRVGSDMNLAATLRNRESSSSLSPQKTDFDDPTLRRSESRYDMKKQQKLSKRVSDLEAKLATARQELNDAFVEASPMPKLTGKYERFTPSGTVKRSRFVPGQLPSLPSERILMADQMLSNSKDTRDKIEGEPRKAIDLTEASDEEHLNDEDTVRAARGKKYPRRAASLFNLNNDDIDQRASSDINTTEPVKKHLATRLPAKTEHTENMDPNSFTKDSFDGASGAPRQVDYATLDQKLKNLDKNVKLARKAAKPKKRKSAGGDEDKTYKPGKGESDVSDWDDEAKPTPKKKQKKGPGSPPRKQAESSPRGKAGLKSTKVANASPKPKGKNALQVFNDADLEDHQPVLRNQAEATLVPDQFSADEDSPVGDGNEGATPIAVDPDASVLDIVYEEEETGDSLEIPAIPSSPSKGMTPASRARSAPGLRSRSSSPVKRARSTEPAPEEQILTRAAEAVKAHPLRQSARGASPGAGLGGTLSQLVKNVHDNSKIDEPQAVIATPGIGGVPGLPKGATGSWESDVSGEDVVESETIIVGTEIVTKKKASFEWPEDVF